MSDFKYDETNKGTLWNNKGKYQIFRQGSINVNGEIPKKHLKKVQIF